MNNNMLHNTLNKISIFSSFIPGLVLVACFVLDYILGIPIRFYLKNTFNLSSGLPSEYPLIFMSLLISPIISVINILTINKDAKKENVWFCLIFPLISVVCGLFFILLIMIILLCYALFIKHALI